jgi:iron-sulfur cluster assembly protein
MEHHVHLDTPTQATSGGPPVTLTEKAIEMVRETMRRERIEGHALRVGVTGGGCSGFKYTLGFEEAAKPDDMVLDVDGVRILIDPTSERYLQGVVLDYVSSLSGGGFKFTNPNASRTCGCGSSFGV